MKKILVIEDEASLREDILEIVECLDFEAVGAENGKIGVEIAQTHLPDLIICDVMMPELDGYGVLNSLKENPATAVTPFIFLSAKADKTDIRQGMNLGADDYLTKPFTILELEEAIAACLEKQERRRQAGGLLQGNAADLRQLEQQKERLVNLTKQMQSSMAFNQILNTTLITVRNLLKTHRCCFFLYDGALHSSSFQLIDEAFVPEVAHCFNLNIFKETPGLGESLLQLNRIQAPDISQEATLSQETRQKLASLGVASLLAVTIQVPSGEVGVLVCEHFYQPRSWSENEVELLQAVADQLPIAL